MGGECGEWFLAGKSAEGGGKLGRGVSWKPPLHQDWSPGAWDLILYPSGHTQDVLTSRLPLDPEVTLRMSSCPLEGLVAARLP